MDLRFGSTFLAISAISVALAGVFAPVSSVHATDSLATPITGRSAQELWPIEVEIAIAPVLADGRLGPASWERSLTIADGHHMTLDTSLATSRGRCGFEIGVVARHHPDAIELEWDLEVAEATYRPVGLGGYLLHRLRLDDPLVLEEPRVLVVRSDISTTRDSPMRQRVEVGPDTYEITIFARSLRG